MKVFSEKEKINVWEDEKKPHLLPHGTDVGVWKWKTESYRRFNADISVGNGNVAYYPACDGAIY